MFDGWRASRRAKATAQRGREERRRVIDDMRDAVDAADPGRVEPVTVRALSDALAGAAGHSLTEALDEHARAALTDFRTTLAADMDADAAQGLAEAIDAGWDANSNPNDLLEAIENWAAYLADPARDRAHMESVLWLTVLAHDDTEAALETVRQRLGVA
ncbi:hypothetical protein OCAE111667_14570 [Occultella aeris]|uniref:Uncharacterized protein n=1 Tax=Occultella aeris TaxID=2761496 RepID=A0A7M4DF13_9MICO|nr:hypothetical protein [Occultella aeris]VZO35506.1 hypothetical protein HALOF300_00704 [Occultella aeris]